MGTLDELSRFYPSVPRAHIDRVLLQCRGDAAACLEQLEALERHHGSRRHADPELPDPVRQLYSASPEDIERPRSKQSNSRNLSPLELPSPRVAQWPETPGRPLVMVAPPIVSPRRPRQATGSKERRASGTVLGAAPTITAATDARPAATASKPIQVPAVAQQKGADAVPRRRPGRASEGASAPQAAPQQPRRAASLRRTARTLSSFSRIADRFRRSTDGRRTRSRSRDAGRRATSPSSAPVQTGSVRVSSPPRASEGTPAPLDIAASQPPSVAVDPDNTGSQEDASASAGVVIYKAPPFTARSAPKEDRPSRNRRNSDTVSESDVLGSSVSSVSSSIGLTSESSSSPSQGSAHSVFYTNACKVAERLKEKDEQRGPGKMVEVPSAAATITCRIPGRSQREENIRAGKRILAIRTSGLMVQQERMVDDGNCLFRAISHQLYGTQERHQEVREQCVQQLMQRREAYALYYGSDEEYDRYVTSMKGLGYWGDEVALKATCDRLEFVAYVLTSTSGNWYLRYVPGHMEQDQFVKLKNIFLTYLSPIHYNSLSYLDGSSISLTPDEVAALPELNCDTRRVFVAAS
eukprot:EG_transcript_6036